MRYLVIGVGSIGARHIRTLQLLDAEAEFACLRSSHGPNPYLTEIGRTIPIATYYDVEDALTFNADACLVCNPTASHAATTLALMDKCRHIFVEKPLAASCRDGELVAQASRTTGTRIVVGYCLRFSPIIRAVQESLAISRIGSILYSRLDVGQDLSQWRNFGDIGDSYSVRASLGGGVILDLSHEVDLALLLYGMPEHVTSVYGKVGSGPGDSEDIAEILLVYPSMICSIHLDCLRTDRKRTMEIVGSKGTLEADLTCGTLTLRRRTRHTRLMSLDPDDPENTRQGLVEEMKHLLRVIQSEEEPSPNAQDAINVLRICDAAKAGRRIMGR